MTLGMKSDLQELTAEELFEHAGWIRKLARALAPGSPSEDLVQDAWLVALQKSAHRHTPLRPWLGQVLRNLKRMRLRTDARRLRREAQVGSPDPMPAADSQLEEI